MTAFNLIGKTLGKYQVLEEIGRGGMGAVYKGYDPILGRPVAIKVLAPHLVWEHEFVNRFLQEARAAARLQHPNIVTIFDVGEQDGIYYTVMQYVDGRPLNEIVGPGGTLPVVRVAGMVSQVASALETAHRQGLVHRDVKPGNILVMVKDRTVLTDFGIARALSEARVTRTGVMIGTPGYISPEQIRGDDVGPAADQYALGVVTYELLAGGHPFKGDTARLLHAHAYEAPPPLRAVNRSVSGSVEAVVMRALAKEPGQRWPSVAAFAAHLEAAAAGKKIPTAQPKKKTKTTARRRVLGREIKGVWLGAAVLVVVVLCIFAATLAALSGSAGPTTVPATATIDQPVPTVTIRLTAAEPNALPSQVSASPSPSMTDTPEAATETATATPSTTPTATPSGTPTATPSESPTPTPTRTPTTRPTKPPTSTPTSTAKPTKPPTAAPTQPPPTQPPPTEPPPTQPPPTQPPPTQPPPTQPPPTQPPPTQSPPTRTPRPP